MDDAMRALQQELPAELFELVAPLFRTRAYAPAMLRERVARYGEALESAWRSGAYPEMDIELGRACGEACMALLDALGDPPDRARHMLAHIAVRYFVTPDDDEDDRESLVGFDDDALVINACARAMGVAEAVIPLAPRW